MGFVSWNWIVGVKALIRAPGGMERDSKSIHQRTGRILPLFRVAVDVFEIRRSRSHKLYLYNRDVSETFGV